MECGKSDGCDAHDWPGNSKSNDISFLIILCYMTEVMDGTSMVMQHYIRLFFSVLSLSLSLALKKQVTCELPTARATWEGDDRWPLVVEGSLWSTASKELNYALLQQQGNASCQRPEGSLKQTFPQSILQVRKQPGWHFDLQTHSRGPH